MTETKAEKKKNKHWIQKAIKHPGSFSAEAKRAGKTTAEFAEENQDAPGILGRRARLAETLMGLRKKK
jgi:hypothetical protein